MQFGGQTPLRIAAGLQDAGVPLLGTPVEAIDLAEDRGRFGGLLDELGHPGAALRRRARRAARRWRSARRIGFPLLVRPSYVLGGRAMELCYSRGGPRALPRAPRGRRSPSRMYPLLLDRFLENAIELDVDALADGEDVYVAGIMQHVEEAGVHSGDSACVLPPLSLGEEMLEEVRRQTRDDRAAGSAWSGLMNVQFGLVDNDRLYVIEANPRASRTVPFVSKAIGVPLAKVACRADPRRDARVPGPAARAQRHAT